MEEAQSVSVSDELKEYIESQRDDLGAPDIVNKWDSPSQHDGGDEEDDISELWYYLFIVTTGIIYLFDAFLTFLFVCFGLSIMLSTWLNNLEFSDSETDSENKED